MPLVLLILALAFVINPEAIGGGDRYTPITEHHKLIEIFRNTSNPMEARRTAIYELSYRPEWIRDMALDDIRLAIKDSNISIRLHGIRALGWFPKGKDQEVLVILKDVLENGDMQMQYYGLQSAQALGERAVSLEPQIVRFLDDRKASLYAVEALMAFKKVSSFETIKKIRGMVPDYPSKDALKNIELDKNEVEKIDITKLDDLYLSLPIQRGLYRLDPVNAELMPVIKKNLSSNNKSERELAFKALLNNPLPPKVANILISYCDYKKFPELASFACDYLRYTSSDPDGAIVKKLIEKNKDPAYYFLIPSLINLAETSDEALKALATLHGQRTYDYEIVQTLLKNKERAIKNGVYFMIVKHPNQDEKKDISFFSSFLLDDAHAKKVYEDGELAFYSNDNEIRLDGDLSKLEKMTVETRIIYGLFSRNPDPSRDQFVPQIQSNRRTYVSDWIQNPKVSDFIYKIDLKNPPELPKREKPISRKYDEMPHISEIRIHIYTRDGRKLEKLIKYTIPYSC